MNLLSSKSIAILFISLFYFSVLFGLTPNEKVNVLVKSLKKYSHLLNEEMPVFDKQCKEKGIFSNPLEALTLGKKEFGKFKTQKGDIVVGQSNPEEKVTLSGEQVISGNIVIVNSGELDFENANIVLYGNILVADSSTLKLNNSTLTIVSRFTYSNGMTIYGNGKVFFSSSTVNSNGFNWNVGIVGNGSWTVSDTVFQNGVTTALLENASAYVTNSNPLEWVIDNNTSLTLKDCPGPFMLWPVFNDGAVADFSFPVGSHVDYFEISDSAEGMANISIKLIVDNCDNINWGMMVKKGSNVTVRDSNLMTTGIMADVGDYWDITGLNNEQYFADYTIPVAGITLRYINSSVTVFNVYQYGADEIKVENSVIGELGVLSGTKCTVWKTMIDGTGGYFFSNSSIVTTFLLSTLLSHAVANEQSIDVFIHSAILGGDIVARDNGVILLANTIHDQTPKAYDGGFIVDALINIPVSESVNSIIPVKGTAYLYYGEQSPVRFSSYSLSYATSENPDNWIPVVQSEETPIENGILGFWNTSGLEPGNYTLKLTLNMNMGDPIEITKNIFLGVEGTGRQTFLIPHIDNGEYWESYLVFDNLTGFYKKAEVFLNKEGRFYRKIDVDLNPYEQKKVSLEGDSGFIRCDSGLSAREFFVSKTEGGIAQFNLSGISGKKINFLMPLYSADILNWEGVAFQNTENLASNVSLKAYSPDGSVIGEKDLNLNPLGKSVGVVNTYFQDIDYSSLARIEANANTLLNGIVISGNGNLNLLFTQGVSIPDAGRYLIPHIANEWDTWENILVFDNLTEQAKTIKLTLFSQGEKVVNSKDYQIPPYGQVTLSLNGFNSLSPDCGYAEVSDGGVAVRQGFKATQGGIAEFLLSSDTSYNLVLNMPQTENDKLNWNGIALMNPNDGDANVTLNAYRSENLIESVQVVIPANQRVVGVLSDFFSNLGDSEVDRVEVISDRPLTGLTISGFNQQLLLFANPHFF